MSDCLYWPQVVAASKDIVLAIAAGVTAYVAVSGIRKWRQELEGKAGFETSRALAKATYRLRNQLSVCRSPLMTGDEYPEGYFDKPNSTNEDKARGIAHVFKNRWGPVHEALADFEAQSLEAETLWGDAIRQKTSELRSCVVELRVAIEALIEDKASGGQDFTADPDFARQMRRTVYGSPASTDNPLSQRIAVAVAGIEDELKQHLGRT